MMLGDYNCTLDHNKDATGYKTDPRVAPIPTGTRKIIYGLISPASPSPSISPRTNEARESSDAPPMSTATSNIKS